MRITGGKLKGRVTETPYGKMAIRPAMDKMRESVFNIIGFSLEGKSFLDLFSGSGTIALEAVSHGASAVTLCEMDKSKAKIILKNVKMAEEVGVRINCRFMSVELFLKRCKEKFDYIFLDPPFPYKLDDDTQPPQATWRSHANLLYQNWLNYFVYQETPYDLHSIGNA